MKKQVKEIVDNTVILERNMERVMHDSMMPYSEHVILERAVPRVEDGLKPVQRRVLFVMHEAGLTPDKAFRKSANVVGETMAKYHPHGDSSIYDTMVRLAQDFNMRVPLVEGSGNFGSMDGDPAAAFRYTEARLAAPALFLMRDLEKETVPSSLNFDDTRREPDILPALFPNLLINGSAGIAVGLATNIPPHNPGEVIDGVIAYLENPKMTDAELMEYIKGPDFPTGGVITNAELLPEIYRTGEGKLHVRARASVETLADGRTGIVITEFPYQTNKAELLAKILEHAQSKREIIAQISDVRDESDRTGVRAVIEVKRGCDAEKLLAYLYRYTDLQKTFGVNMIAIAEGRPMQLSLLDAVRYYVSSRKLVERRRVTYDLRVAKEREEILVGLSIAARDIDRVIAIIRSSKTPTVARERLCEAFSLSVRQANAILEMRLRRITGLEIESIENELAELQRTIAELEGLLADKRKMNSAIRRSLLEIKRAIDSPRRTELVSNGEERAVSLDAFRTVEDAVVYVDEGGNLHRVSEKIFENLQKSEGRIPAERAASLRTDRALLLFGNRGGVYALDCEDIPECRSAKDKGVIPERLVQKFTDDYVLFITPFDPEGRDVRLLFVTEQGMIKCSEFEEYRINRKKFESMLLREGDRIVYAAIRHGESPVEFTLSDGKRKIRRDPVSVTGRRTYGVRAVKLEDGKTVVSSVQSK